MEDAKEVKLEPNPGCKAVAKIIKMTRTSYVCIDLCPHVQYNADATMICLCRIAEVGLCCCVLQ